MRRIFIFSLLWLTALQTLGKERIEGEVRCEEVGVMAALVDALPTNPADTVVTSSTFTDLEGRFALEIDTLPARLRVVARGYNPKDLTVGTSTVSIELEREESELGEVMVKARRLNMKAVPGGFSFDPEAIYAEVRNASEVFGFVPMLSVSQKGLRILNNGRSALILINGVRPSYPQELVLDKLHAIPPEDIKRIEILINPGPAYTTEEVAGGVVNVILEDRYRGANGGVSTWLMWAQNGLRHVAPSLYGFYQNHNLLFSVSGDYTHGTSRTDGTSHLLDTANGLDRLTLTEGCGHTNSVNVKASGELRLPHAQTVTLTLGTGGYSEVSDTRTTETRCSVADGFLESVSEQSTDVPMRMAFGLGARYRKAFGSKGITSLEARFSWSAPVDNDHSDLMYTGIMSAEGQRTYEREQSSRRRYSSLYGVLQFNHRFGDGGRLTATASVSDNPYRIDYTDPDDAYSFRRQLTVESATLTYSKEWSGTFTTQIGVRQMSYFRRLHLAGEETHRYSKTLVLPDVSATLSLGGGRHNLVLGWQMSDQQPYLDNLNPYKHWSSATEYHAGNPDLDVVTKHWFNLTYNFLGDLFMNISYSTGRGLNTNYRYLTPKGTLVHTYLDAGHDRSLNLLAMYNRWLFGYRWRLRATGSVGHYDASTWSPSGEYSQKSWNWMLDFGSTVRILKKPSLSWNISYRYMPIQKKLGYVDSSRQTISTGLSAALWKDAEGGADVMIPLTGQSRTYEMPGLVERTRMRFDRSVMITANLTWRFGKTSIEQAPILSTGNQSSAVK
ncbi:MAG: outer membrane beta-barrel protein [Bacteroides sp.]|nr:outer membrane beta-barrel protein [Bacteroides sp.]MBD5307036.1 outer membrane beta-barrel protein [Bacteroides sp.]